MVNVDGENVSKLPSSGQFYLASYDCNNKNTVVSWDRDENKLVVSNENKKGGISCYLDFQSTPALSSMKVGSYVEYVGDNGCSSNLCHGEGNSSFYFH